MIRRVVVDEQCDYNLTNLDKGGCFASIGLGFAQEVANTT